MACKYAARRGRELAGGLLKEKEPMRRSSVRTIPFFCVTLLGAAPAFAQIHVEVEAPPPPRVVVSAPMPAPPVVRFEAPPTRVAVGPGVEVVRDCDEEVFFSGGWYWHASPEGVWFRTHSYRGGWVVAPRAAVPMAVMRLPRGQYRHFRGEAWREQRHEEHALRHEEHREGAIRHEEHREERAVRHEEHRERKEEHRERSHGRHG
jgi:hypothetical protein